MWYGSSIAAFFRNNKNIPHQLTPSPWQVLSFGLIKMHRYRHIDACRCMVGESLLPNDVCMHASHSTTIRRYLHVYIYIYIWRHASRCTSLACMISHSYFLQGCGISRSGPPSIGGGPIIDKRFVVRTAVTASWQCGQKFLFFDTGWCSAMGKRWVAEIEPRAHLTA